MTKVIINEDCGNSPKNIFVQEISIAFAKANTKFILDRVTDDICDVFEFSNSKGTSIKEITSYRVEIR